MDELPFPGQAPIESVRRVLRDQLRVAKRLAANPSQRRAVEIWAEVIDDLEIDMQPPLAAVAEQAKEDSQ